MSPQLVRHIITIAVGVVAALLLARQCRKPSGWPGRLVVRNMNLRHSRLTDWGLRQVPLERNFTMLDVGCGGGETIRKLAAVAVEGKVYGIDYSAASVEVASRRNAREIADGRVEIRQGSVSHLPFPDGTFDFACAVETHYYWPNLLEDVREIRRVVKPGGRLAVIAETYKGRRFDAIYRPAMRLLRATYLTAPQHRELLADAGFSEVVVTEERSKGWICAVGRRPASEAPAG